MLPAKSYDICGRFVQVKIRLGEYIYVMMKSGWCKKYRGSQALPCTRKVVHLSHNIPERYHKAKR
jgi:hypothetical protein